MQEIKVKVSKEFFNKFPHRKLSSIKLIPKTGYNYKHHLVVKETDAINNVLIGLVGSVSDKELNGEVYISYEFTYE